MLCCLVLSDSSSSNGISSPNPTPNPSPTLTLTGLLFAILCTRHFGSVLALFCVTTNPCFQTVRLAFVLSWTSVLSCPFLCYLVLCCVVLCCDALPCVLSIVSCLVWSWNCLVFLSCHLLVIVSFCLYIRCHSIFWLVGKIYEALNACFFFDWLARSMRR